jgi:hypothetical protein
MVPLSKLNSFVQSLSGWLALFGTMSVAFSWLASKLTPMQGYGWADFVAVGIGSAAGITLVLAAFLVAWRRFRPLPRAEEGEEWTVDGPTIQFPAPEWERRIEALSARLAAQEEAASQKNQARLDNLNLYYWAHRRASVTVIRDLLVEKPKGDPLNPPKEAEARSDVADNVNSWFVKVGGASHHIAYGDEILRTLNHARYNAEAEVRKIKPEDRPSWLDPLEFHDYFVIVKGAHGVADHLEYVLREIDREEAHNTSRFNERLAALQKKR